MNPRVLFVVDAGPIVGGGHFMRSLTLANALAAAGAAPVFATHEGLEPWLAAFAPGIERLPLASPATSDLARAVQAADVQALVFDHYGLTAREHGAIADGRPTLVMDDLADRPLACDLLVDAGLSRRAADYGGLAPPHAELLLGPAFAPIRPDFAAMRQATLARRAAGDLDRVLVSLGLTDLGGVTLRVVERLLPLLGERAFDVVLGAGAASLTPLRALAERDRRIVIHVNAADMALLTASADLAVGAVGSSSWERCVLGLPGLCVVLADNQREAALALARAGAIGLSALEPAGVLEAEFQALLDDREARIAMSRAAAGVCDGQGARRTAERFLSLIAASGRV